MIPILLESINLQIKDTQVAFGDAVMEHNMSVSIVKRILILSKMLDKVECWQLQSVIHR